MLLMYEKPRGLRLEPQRCEDIKGIAAPERDPKSFGTFEKQAPENCQFVAVPSPRRDFSARGEGTAIHRLNRTSTDS